MKAPAGSVSAKCKKRKAKHGVLVKFGELGLEKVDGNAYRDPKRLTGQDDGLDLIQRSTRDDKNYVINRRTQKHIRYKFKITDHFKSADILSDPGAVLINDPKDF